MLGYSDSPKLSHTHTHLWRLVRKVSNWMSADLWTSFMTFDQEERPSYNLSPPSFLLRACPTVHESVYECVFEIKIQKRWWMNSKREVMLESVHLFASERSSKVEWRGERDGQHGCKKITSIFRLGDRGERESEDHVSEWLKLQRLWS